MAGRPNPLKFHPFGGQGGVKIADFTQIHNELNEFVNFCKRDYLDIRREEIYGRH